MTAIGNFRETIAAVATAVAPGSIGIVRVSGPLCLQIADQLAGLKPRPRHAHLADFRDAHGAVLDSGLLLFFPGPASYTGEDVLELQGHGGAVVPHMVLQRVLELGARPARPGEFTERAFLNEKLDLAQAEAVADLISSRSEAAARGALNSLQGAFSSTVNQLAAQIQQVRILSEAHIDFPDEELDVDWGDQLANSIGEVQAQVERVLRSAAQGRNLAEGASVLLVGPPNAGKSSLLNALSGIDAAIVTEEPGTTRDVLRESVVVDGVPVLLMDTAGLRETSNRVEQEGVRRTLDLVQRADQVFLIVDAVAGSTAEIVELLARIRSEVPADRITLVCNKTDLIQPATANTVAPDWSGARLAVSALTGEGLDSLREHIRRQVAGTPVAESVFTARGRHVEALRQAEQRIARALQAATAGAGLELVAEELRLAQESLGQITGAVTSDELLGEIFSGFCIGK